MTAHPQPGNNILLENYNTFHVKAKARYFFLLNQPEELHFLPEMIKGHRYLILGGGSNMLFCQDYDGLIIHPRLKGMHVVEENTDEIHLEVMAGENWDQLVEHTVNMGWSGLENLSLIPGNVGAAPVQNIGAYGVEAGERILRVQCFDPEKGKICSFDKEACRFGYRDSIFKQEDKKHLLVVSVVFSLFRQPRFDTSYARIEEEIQKLGERNLPHIREAIIRIRREKLPDPTLLGNAGSFFKNPYLPSSVFQKLQMEYPDLPGFPNSGDRVKIPAAWLIDRCGWKGYRKGDAGVHLHQPLVLVNHGNATGMELFELSERIRESVIKRFGIELEREVRIV